MSESESFGQKIAEMMRDILPGAHHHTPLGGKPWSREKLYFRADDYYRDVLRGIRQAGESVDFETYIFEAGVLGDKVVSALTDAARRKVRVRLLVDGVGSPDFASHYGSRLSKGGVHFRVYRSWPMFFTSIFHLAFFHKFRAILRNWGELWAEGKHRNHRKQCIIDGKKVWAGGFNVSDWHLERTKGKEAWRDTGIGLFGVRNLVFKLAFHMAWEDVWPHHLRGTYRRLLVRWISHDVLKSPVRVNVTWRLRRLFYQELLVRLASAKKRIWITTPYFVPPRGLVRALTAARKRGCDVQLLLPGVSDVPMVRWASMSFYPTLLRAGCRIFEYQKRVLHAKTLLVDAWPRVGSSNINYRSLRQDLELNVVLQEKESLKALDRQFRKDLLNCREIKLGELKERPFWNRMLSWFFFQFRYWF